MSFITRKIQPNLLAAANSYPIVALIGPRQSGKTTLVKQLFAKKPYVSLEDPDVRHFALSDPRGFLSNYKTGAILDEIQRAPEILSYLQTMVDEDPSPGRFIITGSHQLMLHQAITQSLAGRVCLITLLPFSYEELSNSQSHLELDDFIYQGFYPRIYDNNLNPTEAYRNYCQTYVERDVRLLIHLKDLFIFERFLKLCAGRIGQVLNYNSLASDVGVSPKTIKEWVSLLEASYIIKILPPYFENFGKRVVKSPKLYFIDVGLAAYLLDLHQPSQINRDPLRGALVENLLVMEVVKYYLNHGELMSLFYFRDNHGNEVDLLLKRANYLIPIEIKASSTYNNSFLKHLKWFKELLQERMPNGFVIYNGQSFNGSEDIQIANWKKIPDILKNLSV